jgi:hypothetical protein
MTDTAFSHFEINLLGEQQQGRLLHQAALDWFTANGVNALSLAKTPWDEYDFVNIDDVVWHACGAFEFARYSKGEKADSACTFVVRDSLGFPLDIVAWQATTGRVATWLGRASMIGEDQLFAPRLTEGLPVFETPLGWFQERRAGVVVLNKARAAPRLRDAGPLLASSFEHGKKLNEMLRLPPPRILVPASVEEAREVA